MKQIMWAALALAGAFSARLSAADSQLLNLVMPDAKVLAGVNVTQAKSSPFGQYLLSQITAGNANLSQLTAVTGFDPTRDVNELLVASTAVPGAHTGLLTATGTFDTASLTSFAASHGGVTESYSGVTILEDPQKTHGVAFLTGSLMVAGDLPGVRAAIDRRANPAILPAAQVTQVQQLSGANDAWWLANTPVAGLLPALPSTSNTGIPANVQTALAGVQSLSGGVKFGAVVNFNAQAQTASPQDATNLAAALQFLISMGQLSSANNPQAAAALQSLTAIAQGSAVNIVMNLPEDQFQQLFRPRANMARPHRRNPK
jgi:hypothetical protein